MGNIGCDFDGKERLDFRSIAKLVADRLPSTHKAVFLDHNVLPVKNCDELFRTDGVQMVEGKDGSPSWNGIMVKSRSIGKDDQDLITKYVVEKENGILL